MRIPQPKAESTTSHTSTLQGSDSTSIHQPLDLPWFRTFAQRKTSATSPLDSTSMSPLSDYEGVLLSPVSSAGSQVTVRTPSPEESQRPIERSSTFYRPLTVRAESLGSNFQDATHGRMLYEQPEPMRSPVSAALSPVLIRPPSYTFIDNVPTSTTLDYSTIIEQRAGSPVSRLSTPQSLYESRPSTAIQDSQYAAERTRRLSEAIRLDSPTPISIRSPSPVSPSAHTRTCRGCISIARSPSPPGFTPHTGSPTSNRSSSPAYSIYPRICTPMPPMSPHYSSRLFRPPSISPDTVDRSRNLASATYHSPVLAHPRVHSPATQVTISRSSTPVFAPNRLMSPQPASEITSTVIIDSPREPPSVIPPTYTYPDIPAVLHSMYDDDSSNNAGASRRTYKTPNAGHSESSQLSPPTVLPILLQSFSDDNGNGPSIGPSAGNGHINNRQPRFIPSVAPSAQNVPANRPHWSRQRYDGGGGSGQPNIHAASSHPNSATFRSDHAKSTPRVPWTGPVLQPRISPRTRYPPSSLSTIPGNSRLDIWDTPTLPFIPPVIPPPPDSWSSNANGDGFENSGVFGVGGFSGIVNDFSGVNGVGNGVSAFGGNNVGGAGSVWPGPPSFPPAPFPLPPAPSSFSSTPSLFPPSFPPGFVPTVPLPQPFGQASGLSVVPHNNPKPHHRFYFTDGSVTIQIHDTLYKIHSVFIQHNAMWLYSYSYAPREIPRFASVFSSVYIGGSRVVKLQGIETHQFDLVLSLFYPKDLLHQEPKSFNDWSDILHVAHTIDMYQIGALAISKINDLGSTVSPVDKIDLANKYGIKEWLEPSYMALVGRLDDLTLEEDKKIGRGAQLIHSCRDAVRGQLQMLIEENNVYLPAP